MANPLEQEEKLYQQIKTENILVPPDTWRFIYQHIGNAVSVINLMSNYYVLIGEPMPVEVAKGILKFTQKIKQTLDCVLYPHQGVLDGDLFKQYRIENITLHPIIREMLKHYIGNDVFRINLIAGDSVDPAGPQPVSIDNLYKIIDCTHSLKIFMDKLREATCELVGF
ncbi:MAG: hypothetical protein ACOY3D_02590 [Candidatus Omnitrophota bacterium]